MTVYKMRKIIQFILLITNVLTVYKVQKCKPSLKFEGRYLFTKILGVFLMNINKLMFTNGKKCKPC